MKKYYSPLYIRTNPYRNHPTAYIKKVMATAVKKSLHFMNCQIKKHNKNNHHIFDFILISFVATDFYYNIMKKNHIVN